MAYLTVADLQVFKPEIDEDKAEAMIEDASAMAERVAPCIATSTDEGVLRAVKAVLRAAILRWEDAGSGALQTRQETTGPFNHQETFDTRVRQYSLFRPDEITTLQGLCSASSGKAFMVDLMPPREV